MKPTSKLRHFLLAAGSGLLALSSAHAQSTWDGSENGSWFNDDNWDVAPIDGAALTFSGVANLTNTNDTGLTEIGLLTLNGGGWDIAVGTLILNGGIVASGTSTLPSPGYTTLTLGADQTWSNSTGMLSVEAWDINNNGNTLTIGGAGDTTIGDIDIPLNTWIFGTGGLTKEGTGTLNLYAGSGTLYEGATTVNAGVLSIHTQYALGDTAAGTIVAAGAALEIQGGILLENEALTLSGSGIANDGALRSIGGSNSFTGPITLAGDTRIHSSGGTLVLDQITGAHKLTLGGGASTTFAASSDFSGGLVVDGGTFEVGSAQSFTGGLTLNNGGNLTQNTGGALLGSNVVTFAGTGGSINAAGNERTFHQGAIDSGATANLNATNDTKYVFTNGLTGSGNVVMNGGSTASSDKWLTINNSSDFTGNITIGAADSVNRVQLNFTALGDGGKIVSDGGSVTRNAVNLNYTGAGATFNTRQLEIANTISSGSTFIDTGIAVNANQIGGGATALIFNTNLLNTSTGSAVINRKKLLLSGTTAGLENEFNGTIINSTAASNAAILWLQKTGASTWNVTNASNSYTGGTVVSGGILGFTNGALGTTGAINASGGTLRWNTGNTQDISGRLAMTNASTSTFDTGGNNVTFASAIGSSSTGALAKTGAGTLTLSGSNTYTGATTVNGGTLILSGANSYTGGTNVTQGTLVARSASALGGVAGNTTIAVGAALNYEAAANAALSIGGTLAINGGAGTAIGGTIGATLDSARINVLGNATSTAAAVKVNIYGNSFSATTDGTGIYTLVKGNGVTNTLNNATLSLGTVYNNTNFTVGALSSTTSTIDVAITQVVALSGDVFWKGGLADNTGVWSASNGITQSNWQAPDGVDQALAPGATADLVFSTATSPGTMAAMTLGADMTVQTLTVNDTSTAFGLNADGSKLTITPGAAVDGITIASGVLASTIAANVGLGAAQTWTNNSANALTVSGVVSGASTLAKAGTGTIVLSAANTYTGATTISAGTMEIGGSGTLGSGNYMETISNAGTLKFNSSAAQTLGGGISGAGALVKDNSGTLTLTAANAYAGGTSINGGTVHFDNRLAMPDSGNVSVADGATLSIAVASSGTTWGGGTGNGGIAGLVSSGLGSQAGSTVSFAGNSSLLLNVTGVTTENNNLTNGAATNLTLIKAGASSLTLGGDNSYTGGTTLNAGTLSIGHANALGTGAGTIALNGGTIQSNDATARIFNDAVTIGGNFTVGGTGNLTFSNTGASALGASRIVTVTTAAVKANFAQAFSGDELGLIKAGAGTLELAGASTYTGVTNVSAGTLAVTNLANGGADSSIGASTNAASNLLLANGTTLRYTGDGDSTDRSFRMDVSGQPRGVTLDASGSGAINFTNTASPEYGVTSSNQSRSLTLRGTNTDANTLAANLANNGGNVVSVTKADNGTWVLSGTSAYTGVTNVSGGTLVVTNLANGGADSSIGRSTNASTNLLLANGTTLRYTGDGDSTDRSFRFNGSAVGLNVTLDASGSGAINFTNTANPTHSSGNQTRTLNLRGTNTGANTLAANLANNTQALSVTKSDAGTWILSGTSTYTGGTDIAAGTLAFANDSLGASGNIAFTGNSTLRWHDTNTQDVSSRIVMNNEVASTIDTNGNDVTFGTAIGSSTTGSLTKAGAGTLTLSGNNTYTGATTVNGGTLVIGGSVTSDVTVNNTGTLGGTGTIFGDVLVNAGGTLSPGNSPGTLIQNGGTLQLGGNGNYNWQVFNAIGAAGTGYDTYSLTNGAELDLTLLSAMSPYNVNLWSLSAISPDVNGDATSFDNTQNYSWTLFSTDLAITGFNATFFNISVAAANGTSGFSNDLGGGFFSIGLGDGDTDLMLNFTMNFAAIPEPTTALAGLLLAAGLLRRRRN